MLLTNLFFPSKYNVNKSLNKNLPSKDYSWKFSYLLEVKSIKAPTIIGKKNKTLNDLMVKTKPCVFSKQNSQEMVPSHLQLAVNHVKKGELMHVYGVDIRRGSQTYNHHHSLSNEQ